MKLTAGTTYITEDGHEVTLVGKWKYGNFLFSTKSEEIGIAYEDMAGGAQRTISDEVVLDKHNHLYCWINSKAKLTQCLLHKTKKMDELRASDVVFNVPGHLLHRKNNPMGHIHKSDVLKKAGEIILDIRNGYLPVYGGMTHFKHVGEDSKVSWCLGCTIICVDTGEMDKNDKSKVEKHMDNGMSFKQARQEASMSIETVKRIDRKDIEVDDISVSYCAEIGNRYQYLVESISDLADEIRSGECRETNGEFECGGCPDSLMTVQWELNVELIEEEKNDFMESIFNDFYKKD